MKNLFFLIIFIFSGVNQGLAQSGVVLTQETEKQDCKKVIVVDDILGIELETEVCEPKKSSLALG
ncbi:MAG: hypothetical protein AB8G05_26615 [Oligoflexales bacterium]